MSRLKRGVLQSLSHHDSKPNNENKQREREKKV